MWNRIVAIFLSIIAFFQSMFGLAPKNPVKPEISGFTDEIVSLIPNNENYMISPLSIVMAFGMLANGACGSTLEQICDTLGIKDLSGYNDYAATLIEKYSKADVLTLNISNSVWLNTDHAGKISFNHEFTNQLDRSYDAQVETVTNANAVNNINSWVNGKTNGRISKIIDSGDFLCCLLNTIYFKAAWAAEFSESETYKQIFTSRDGSRKKLDFMHNMGIYNYCEADGTQIVELPYVNRSNGNFGRSEVYDDLDVSMYVILSNGKVYPESLLESAEFKQTGVALSLPKFKTEFSVALNDILMQLGMTDIFDPNKADLTAAFDNLYAENPYVSTVLQKTYISVDERGTEAAAVTAISVETTSITDPKKYVKFEANKPFTYVIRDNNNGEILFVGEYAFAQ